MAPNYGRESRGQAHRGPNSNISEVNGILLGRPQATRNSHKHAGDRARETQRKRDHQKHRSELKVGRSSSSTGPLRRPARLADRVTYHRGDSPKICNGAPALPPCSHQGHRPQQHVACEGTFRGDGASKQPLLSPDAHEAQVVLIDGNTKGNKNADADDFTDLFCPEQPPPRPPRQPMSTKPIQHGSSLLFNLHVHPPRPVQPSNRREPIRMINAYTPRESTDDGLLSGAVTELPSLRSSNASVPKKHPANPYKGRDPIKRRVQNNLLRCILADKPLPKPRKQADRMVLKCTGRQEFR